MSEENTEMTTETAEKKTKAKAPKKTKAKAPKAETAAPAKRRGRPPGSKNKARRGRPPGKAGKFKINSFVRVLKRVETTRAKLARLEKELKKLAKQAAA